MCVCIFLEIKSGDTAFEIICIGELSYQHLALIWSVWYQIVLWLLINVLTAN